MSGSIIKTIFACKNSPNGFMEFSVPSRARIYYLDHYYDLLLRKRVPGGLELLKDELAKVNPADFFESPRVWHFAYELGYAFIGHEEWIAEDAPLAVELIYSRTASRKVPGTFGTGSAKNIFSHCRYQRCLALSAMLSEKKSWNFSDYEQAFKKGYDHLLKGDSYQFDLTGRFLFSISKDTAPMDLAHALWNGMPGPAPYAHMSVLGETGICLLSNSPECLFQIRGHGNGTWIETMPIKGTLKCSGTSGDIARAWKELTNSEKNEAELFMITDLMRNDLYKITRETVQVVKKKARLLVPGLIHQYSLLCSPLKTNVSLLHLLNAIFPGGSVVGAPKKRTMEILHEIEDSPRGFYCGSTLILHRSLRRASINIRTAEINLITRLLTYGAGGGITLLSDVHEEYEETLGKRDSFIKLLGRAISQK